MNQQPDSPIDLNHLNEISEGDIEFEIELLQTYCEDVLLRIEKTREAIADNDWVKIMSNSHQIKGSSGNVGAYQVEKLAAQLEALDRNAETALAIVDQISIGIKAVEGFLAQKISNFLG